MPLSADPTVHLTRVSPLRRAAGRRPPRRLEPDLVLRRPARRSLHPVLGDLSVLALRVLSLGLLDWPQAYALLFTPRVPDPGPRPAALAGPSAGARCPACAPRCSPSPERRAYREGGWTYTVLYGVWPQTLATALAQLTTAGTTLAARAASPVLSDSTTPPVLSGRRVVTCPSDGLDPPVPTCPTGRRPGVRRHLALAASRRRRHLITCPMALMMLALGAPLYLMTIGLRGGPTRRSQLAETALHLTLVLSIGAALAAWWLLPMSAHRGWMANSTAGCAPLADMLRMASHGQWTQLCPPPSARCASLGLLAAALLGRAPLRFFACGPSPAGCSPAPTCSGACASTGCPAASSTSSTSAS
ncbi:hypothetical protein [Nannocystis sp.]|uniref:hypothetical protein n=1 Tax=Nannocystis sp. TaxID=1962667 RepID=UPI0025E72A35|nr:hypothetical protein [Nannocystis sp.]MBK7826495.1 hypothetical protein [Nannocystis sp.]